MQVTETQNEGLKRGYKITVSAAELESKVNEKLTEARPEVELKGFRKGRVPMALLKKRLGARVMGDAMQEAIDGAMAKHFEETGDRPAMQPQVTMTNEAWKEGDDVEVSMTYETLPDVPEVEFGAIALERLVVKADDAAIDEALASLAKSVPSFAGDDSGEPAKDGDQVVIDFVGRIGDEAFEGGSGEDQPLVLGSNTFIPGFEAQLVGAKTGDEVKVTVTFPENYTAKKLAGKEAVFDCTVKAVKARQETPIDDALAKKFGADDLAALRTQITERLENEYRGAARSVLKRRLLDALDEKVGFELPPSLVEAEANQIAHQLWHEEHDHPDAPGSAEHDDEHEHGEHEGHDHGEHDHEGHDHEGHDHDAHAHGHIEPTDEHRKLAERRVRLGLLLAEVGRKQEIKVTDQEMTQAVLEQARQYPGQERQFFEFVQQNAGVRQQIQAPIFEDKVVDFIFELAQITDRDVDRDALKAAVEALDD